MGRNPSIPRSATAGDLDELLGLWIALFDEDVAEEAEWRGHARRWLADAVDDRHTGCLAVVEVDGRIVAGAAGTLEVGVPNPESPRGRAVRLANVYTLPGHRGRGYGTALTGFVVDWAREINADRVDLSATPEGRRIYAKAGFVLTSAPRMKRVL